MLGSNQPAQEGSKEVTTLAEVKVVLKGVRGRLLRDEKYIDPKDETKDNVPYFHAMIPPHKVPLLFAELDGIIEFVKGMKK